MGKKCNSLEVVKSFWGIDWYDSERIRDLDLKRNAETIKD